VADLINNSVARATAIAVAIINGVSRTNTVAIPIGDSVTWAGDGGTFLACLFTLFGHFFLFAFSFLFLLFAFLCFPLVLAILVSSYFWYICFEKNSVFLLSRVSSTCAVSTSTNFQKFVLFAIKSQGTVKLRTVAHLV
jgi:hypothetical protein